MIRLGVAVEISVGFGFESIGESIPEGAEPTVQRQGGFPVVTLKIAVVEIVKIGARGQFAVEQGAFKAVVASGGRQGGVLRIEEKMQGMRWHDPMD